MSIVFGTIVASSSLISIEGRAAGGDGGGVFSNLTASSRFLGNRSRGGLSSEDSLYARFWRFVGGWLSFAVVVDAGDAIETGDALLDEARGLARAAGTWMPSECSDSVLCRVLYGRMMAQGSCKSKQTI
jgi:hypothetical protein